MTLESSVASCSGRVDPQAPAVASAANLRALYISSGEAGQLLLTAHRLRTLTPRLAVDNQPLAGAVVAVCDCIGGLAALARIERVVCVVKAGAIDAGATLVVLQPARPGGAPVPLSSLWGGSAHDAPAEQWAAATHAYQQAGGGALLGSCAAVALTAWRMAQLALLAQPLTRLAALLPRRSSLSAAEQVDLSQQLLLASQLRVTPPAAGQLRSFVAGLQGSVAQVVANGGQPQQAAQAQELQPAKQQQAKQQQATQRRQPGPPAAAKAPGSSRRPQEVAVEVRCRKPSPPPDLGEWPQLLRKYGSPRAGERAWAERRPSGPPVAGRRRPRSASPPRRDSPVLGDKQPRMQERGGWLRRGGGGGGSGGALPRREPRLGPKPVS